MMLRKETEKIQQLLGDYCRSGIEREIPGLTPGRVHHYRRLVYNVVRDNMDTAFPITRAALGDEQWEELVHDFFSGATTMTPQIWKLPLEFYRYHAAKETGERIQKPYLDDLLYFEWMEIEVHTMPDRSFPAFTKQGNVFRDILAFNPESEIIRLSYPVHLYPAREASGMKGDYFTLLFRVQDSGRVRFLDLSGLNTYIVTRLAEEHIPLNNIKGTIAQATGIESGRYLDDVLEKFIRDLMDKQLILGYLKGGVAE